MGIPTPILAKAQTAARLLDMSLGEFRDLVDAGSLPMPIRVGGKLDRWPVDQLKAIASGEMLKDVFEW
jgi:predicted DNA-binding transcriptional regulator AlpA